jgi:hypothetical protein
MDKEILKMANLVVANVTEPDGPFMTAFVQSLTELSSPVDMSPVSIKTLTQCATILEEDMQSWPEEYRNPAFADMTLALLVGLEMGRSGWQLP